MEVRFETNILSNDFGFLDDLVLVIKRKSICDCDIWDDGVILCCFIDDDFLMENASSNDLIIEEFVFLIIRSTDCSRRASVTLVNRDLNISTLNF